MEYRSARGSILAFAPATFRGTVSTFPPASSRARGEATTFTVAEAFAILTKCTRNEGPWRKQRSTSTANNGVLMNAIVELPALDSEFAKCFPKRPVGLPCRGSESPSSPKTETGLQRSIPGLGP